MVVLNRYKTCRVYDVNMIYVLFKKVSAASEPILRRSFYYIKCKNSPIESPKSGLCQVGRSRTEGRTPGLFQQLSALSQDQDAIESHVGDSRSHNTSRSYAADTVTHESC